jgi:hypothetical protein
MRRQMTPRSLSPARSPLDLLATEKSKKRSVRVRAA